MNTKDMKNYQQQHQAKEEQKAELTQIEQPLSNVTSSQNEEVFASVEVSETQIPLP